MQEDPQAVLGCLDSRLEHVEARNNFELCDFGRPPQPADILILCKQQSRYFPQRCLCMHNAIEWCAPWPKHGAPHDAETQVKRAPKLAERSVTGKGWGDPSSESIAAKHCESLERGGGFAKC